MKTILLTVLTILLGGLEARAFVGDSIFLPPHAGYLTTETSHFVLIYPEAYTREARESAGFLEEAYAILTKAFQYAPGHKCKIILTDNSDFANGLTSTIGLQGIVLYLIAPDPYTSVGEYDHWLRSLIVHEYAHYVTLEQRRGVFEFLKYPFGNLFFANQFWPTWISEGMAVYAESVFTGQGRGHGTYYSTITRDGLARGTLNEDHFLEFNQLSGSYPDFPFGEAAYFAGYAMIDEMINRHGANSPARFAEESSWRLPWFFNNGTLENISRDHNAETFQSLWSLWVLRAKKDLAPELAWLKAHGSADPAFVTEQGAAAIGTRLSPDGTRLAYSLTSGHEAHAIYIADLTAPHAPNEPAPAHKIEDAIANPGLAWNEDGTRLYYSKTDYTGPYSLYSDLFAYDVARGSVTRLTTGERAKDPDYCAGPGEARLVYTTQTGQSSELRTLALGSGKISTIYRAPLDHHISNPRCTADGRRVYFAEHSTTPLEAMYSVAIEGGKPVYLFGGGAQAGFGALFPEPAADGSLYFTRVLDGYYDLARWSPASKQVRLVARSSGGYWLPSLSRGQSKTQASAKMSVSFVTSTGIRAALLDPEKMEAAINASPSRPPRPTSEITHQSPKETPAPEITNSHGYNLLSSLAPRFWSPYILLADAQSQIGASLLGWDDTDQLEYTLFAWYDSLPRKPEGIFSTFHRFGSFKLNLGAASQISAFATSGNLREYNEERKFTAVLQRPFPGIFSSFTPSLVAEWGRITRDGDFSRRVFSPDQRLGANLSFNSQKRFTYSLTRETGVFLDLAGRRLYSGPFHAWKGMATVNPLIPFFPRHANISLNAYYAVSPNPDGNLPISVVRVGGAGTTSDLDPPLRGYPLGNFEARRAAVLQAEYRVPVAQIFRGLETWPLFFNNLGPYAFYDGAKLQLTTGDNSPWLASVGGGLLLNTEVGFTIPVQIRLEFAHGLNRGLNGQNAFSAGIRF